MQKKYKWALIVISITLVVLTLVLVLLGLATVELDQVGLNYSKIAANYADTIVYGPGLYYIGIANTFIRINKNMQTVSYKNLTTFTSDFYALTANLEVSFLYNFSTSDSFTTVSNFYMLMGENPQQILYPLIQNEILIILSSKNSSFYQSTNPANSQLQSLISATVQAILSKWIGVTVSVIIQSLVCEGTTTNTQIVDRQIESLMHDIERAANEKVELTDYFNSIKLQKQFQMSSVLTAIKNKVANLQSLMNAYAGTTTNIAQILYENQPLKYNMNLVNVLQELAIIGNRTFPY